ncbi:MAG: phosphopantetheine-binding protein [Solirubrobacteraceae bacterium]
MTTAQTKNAVESVIVEALARLGPEPGDVTRGATFEALAIDSLDLVEVAQIVEEEFGVILRGEDMEKLHTVGEAIDLVSERAA